MKNILVGNVSLQATEKELLAAFSKCGEVERIIVITDRETGPRRFAFVEMTASQDADSGEANDSGGAEQQIHHLPTHVLTGESHTVDLDDIVAVTARAMEVFGTREKAIRWLRTPLPALSGRTPLSTMNTADGIKRLDDILGRIEQGVW